VPDFVSNVTKIIIQETQHTQQTTLQTARNQDIETLMM